MRPLAVESVVPKTYSAFGENGPTGLTSIVAGVIGNPIYVALLLTVMALLVITYVLDYTNGVAIDSRSYLKLFIYMFIASCTLLMFHHSIHVQSLIKEYRSSGIKDVYHTVEGIRAAGIMPSAPVEVAYRMPDGAQRQPYRGNHESSDRRDDSMRSLGGSGDDSDESDDEELPNAVGSAPAPDFEPESGSKVPRLESAAAAISYNQPAVTASIDDTNPVGPPGTIPIPPPIQNSAFGYT